MNKERLEEIKNHQGDADESIDEYEYEKINFYNLHVDWLIEQAEQKQSLETAVNFYQSALRDADKLVQELEEAIADYAYEIGKRKRALGKKNEQNKRYREAIKRAIGKFNYDEHQQGMSILLKALEESK